MSGKYTIEQKVAMVIESFSSTNIAELCMRYGISVAQLHRWKKKFIEGGSKALGESSRGNEYQRLVGDQALIIAAFKRGNR